MLEYIKPMVIFTMDASEPVSQTDLALFNRLIDLHLPLVVALTKIDKISKEELDRLIKGFNVSLYQSKRVDYV
jgi:GTP-binding protein EngB required for normal cell division